MPYKIEPYKEGFRVCDSSRCFSNKPLSKSKAQRQRIAIAMSEHKKTGKAVKSFFV